MCACACMCVRARLHVRVHVRIRGHMRMCDSYMYLLVTLSTRSHTYQAGQQKGRPHEI